MRVQFQGRMWLSILFYLWTRFMVKGNVTDSNEGYVTINSTISDEQLVYPGQRVVLTCTTRDSNLLAWESLQYLGLGNQLAFTSDQEGKTLSHGSITTKLDSVSSNESRLTMQSTATIVVSDSQKATSSITCRNVDHNVGANHTVRKNDQPSVRVNISNNQPCINSSHTVQFNCTVERSLSLQWSIELLLGIINCSCDSNCQSDVNWISILSQASCNNTGCTCTSTVNFSAAYLPANRGVNITCRNLELGSEESIFYVAPQDQCPTVPSSTTNPQASTPNGSTKVTVSYRGLMAVTAIPFLVSYLGEIQITALSCLILRKIPI